MFDSIAPRYDLVNRVVSFRRDVAWRNRLVESLPAAPSLRVLDVATGTGDVLLTAVLRRDVAQAVGVDLAGEMLSLGGAKMRRRGVERKMIFARGDALALPLPDGAVDAVTIAFGIRNVLDPVYALREMRRVLAPGGQVSVLEFSLPRRKWFRALHVAYMRHFLARLGGWITGAGAAYRYLHETIETFPYGEGFLELMREAGLTELRATELSWGIASLYTGKKPSE